MWISNYLTFPVTRLARHWQTLQFRRAMYTSEMTGAENTRPKAGDKVALTAIPPGMLDDLPTEDQQAITEAVGKQILLTGYDEDGRAELEFQDDSADTHFIYVRPEFIRKAVEPTR
jgi:hypothetical protein